MVPTHPSDPTDTPALQHRLSSGSGARARPGPDLAPTTAPERGKSRCRAAMRSPRGLTRSSAAVRPAPRSPAAHLVEPVHDAPAGGARQTPPLAGAHSRRRRQQQQQEEQCGVQRGQWRARREAGPHGEHSAKG